MHSALLRVRFGKALSRVTGPCTQYTDIRGFADEKLLAYLNVCRRVGGAVTLNVGIYQWGIMAQATIEQVRRMATAMREADAQE